MGVISARSAKGCRYKQTSHTCYFIFHLIICLAAALSKGRLQTTSEALPRNTTIYLEGWAQYLLEGFLPAPPQPTQIEAHNTDPRCATLRTHFATWSSAAPWHMTCGSARANSNPFAQHMKLKFFIKRVDSSKWMRAVFSINDKCYT